MKLDLIIKIILWIEAIIVLATEMHQWTLFEKFRIFKLDLMSLNNNFILNCFLIFQLLFKQYRLFHFLTA